MSKIEKLTDSMIRFKIDEYQIIMEELGENQGKIIITRWDNRNYSYYWGAMGKTLNEFIKSINGHYFANALISSERQWIFDVKETLSSVKEDLKYEIEGGAFRRHLYNEFKSLLECDDMNDFDSQYRDIITYQVDFSLIVDSYDRNRIECYLNELNLFHYFQKKYSNEYNDIVKLHGKIIKHLNKYGKKETE